MLNIDRAWQEFLSLSPEAQQQVVDFIAFMRERYQNTAPVKPVKQRELKKEPFVGMWRGREELTDSTTWVRQLREKEWTGYNTDDSR